MSGLLHHTPAKIIRQLLVDLHECVDPPGSDSNWPATAHQDLVSPDNTVLVGGTTGIIEGTTMWDHEPQEKQGIQIRVRGSTDEVAGSKIQKIADTLRQVYRHTVTVGSSVYLIHSISRSSGPFPLGKESPTSSRKLYTLNLLVTVKQLS